MPAPCGAIFDDVSSVDELAKLETQAASPDFWKDQAAAQRVLQRRRRLKDDRALHDSLRRRSEDLTVLVDWAAQGEVVDDDLNQALDDLNAEVETAEIKKMLGGEHDRKNAIVSIHPGAGGTESQDWASMLYRLYSRWCERNGYKTKVLNYQDGDEAGIKDVSLEVHGDFAYGNLKAERGVHRLIRISPFDSNAKRHTSFASVFVSPVLNDDVEISILDKDIRIDTYRASGSGGQHVNKTDSAVRITHLESGIVVQCQNERSQLKNKNTAMKMLKARLYQAKMEEMVASKEHLTDEKKEISWGSQIRTYVFHPYNMVKDHRTKCESSNIQSVMDGNIDAFVRAFLLAKLEK